MRFIWLLYFPFQCDFSLPRCPSPTSCASTRCCTAAPKQRPGGRLCSCWQPHNEGAKKTMWRLMMIDAVLCISLLYDMLIHVHTYMLCIFVETRFFEDDVDCYLFFHGDLLMFDCGMIYSIWFQMIQIWIWNVYCFMVTMWIHVILIFCKRPTVDHRNQMLKVSNYFNLKYFLWNILWICLVFWYLHNTHCGSVFWALSWTIFFQKCYIVAEVISPTAWTGIATTIERDCFFFQCQNSI